MRPGAAAALLFCGFAVALTALFLARGVLGADAPDPGPPDFARLVRLASADDALICPRSLCLRARADLTPPIFTESAWRLREKLLAYARATPLTDEIRVKRDPARLRFIQRFSTFGQPLYIDILLAARSEDAATVAMYARGAAPNSFDHASDLARLRAWLDALSD